jgi:hypothetical protein
MRVRSMWRRVATTHESRQLWLSVLRQIKRLATVGRSDELGVVLASAPRCLGQCSRFSELPTKGALFLLRFSSPLWPPIEPNGPFVLRRRRFWPLFLTNRQAPKTSPVELRPRGEAPRRTCHRASRRELPGCGCRPSKEYARLNPILLTNCGIGRDGTAGRAFPPELILRPRAYCLRPCPSAV